MPSIYLSTPPHSYSYHCNPDLMTWILSCLLGTLSSPHWRSCIMKAVQCSTSVVSSSVRLLGFQSQLYHFLAVCSWVTYLASLRLYFFICKIKITMVAISSTVMNNWRITHGNPWGAFGLDPVKHGQVLVSSLPAQLIFLKHCSSYITLFPIIPSDST